MAPRLQRSPHLVAWWQDARLRLRDPQTGRTIDATPAVLAAVSRASRPISRPELADADAGIDDALVDELVDAGVLRPHAPASRDDGWSRWSPEATLFHFGTKDQPFDEAAPRGLTIITERPPPPLKRYPTGDRDTELPPIDASRALGETLLRRRTWRRFADEPVSLDEISDLLGMTWGVQHWAAGAGGERLALKTSPSGGAKHSIEVYVAAQRVEGLEPATYHYCPDRHYLSHVTQLGDGEQRRAWLPAQPYYAEAPAIFFLTSVFARVQSKYCFARAYRVISLEAGHLAQTFCLLATERDLAPFCTAALGDTAIERHLGIDGISESVLYVVGVGRRPVGVEWAPFEDERAAPRLAPPQHRRRTRL